jgi:Mce-associated membrane protein
MSRTYDNRADAVDDGGFWSVLSIERDEAVTSETRAGEDVGVGTIEAMAPAPQAEQLRTADQIEAAAKMANAFLNLDHESIEADIETVKSLATGPFLRQYTRASDDLIELTRRAQATQAGEVEWAGLVAGDDDSATVIVATSGTVANKLTDFEPVGRTYRLQLEVDLVDGRWLTSDLQYLR